MIADLALRLLLVTALAVPLAAAQPTVSAPSAPAATAATSTPSAAVDADAADLPADTTTDRAEAAGAEVSVTEVAVVVPAVTDVAVEVTPGVVADPEAAGTTQEPQAQAEPLVAAALEPASEAGAALRGDAGRVVTDVLETDGFQTLGVTWPEGADVADLDAQVRTRATDGSWTDWQVLEEGDSAPDAGTADAEAAQRGGTDALWVGEADAVQVSFAATTEAGPDDLALTLVDVPAATVTSAADALATGTATVVGAGTATAAAAPYVISREAWGARPQVCQPDTAGRLVGAVLHHTAGSNAYSTQAQAMQQIRGDQAYHIDGRGWCDIGYNFVVDKWGNIYEGRDNSLTSPVIGVHAGGFNTGTVGISMLGTYDAAPSAATQNAVAALVGWRLGSYGLNPSSTMSYYTYGGQNSKIPANTTITLPRVFGHRDVAYTACPGNGGYSALPGIRALATQLSADQRYAQATSVVKALYQDLLGRAPDAGGLVAWAGQLAAGGGQGALVGSLTDSDEYIRMRITAAYQAAMGRAPDAGGMEYWYQRIRARSATVDDVLRRFYDTPEFISRTGSRGAYVSLLYQTIFERPATAAEAQYWSGQIARSGERAVVDAIWFSMEAAQYRAGGYYRTYFGREYDAAGRQYWAGVLLAKGEGAVRVGLAGSEEYRARALSRFP